MTTTVPHIAFPFRRLPNGRIAMVEQDTLDEVTQNVEVILRTMVGTRIEIPGFGITPLVFEQQGGRQVDRALDEVAAWEPRAQVFADERPGDLDELVHEISVKSAYREVT